MEINDLINGWLKGKFLESSEYDRYVHGEENNVFVVSGGAGWECGCYSEYTRDDTFKLKATMVGKSGNFEYEYGSYADFPSYIEELSAYQNNPCPHERDETSWSW